MDMLDFLMISDWKVECSSKSPAALLQEEVMIKSKIFTIIYKAMQNEYNDQPTDKQQER